MQRISHKDIAIKAGVSQSTVSRALQGNSRIARQTREAIQAIAASMGYKPDAMMSRLAVNRWRKQNRSAAVPIAFIQEQKPNEIGIGDEYPPFEAMRTQATALGYHLNMLYWPDYPNGKALQRVLRSRGIVAILFGSLYYRDYTKELDLERFICLSGARGVFQFPLESVCGDYFKMILLAWNKAVAYGYKRIGLAHIKHTMPLYDDEVRLAAVHTCQTHIHAKLARIPVLYYYTETESEAYLKWYEKYQPDLVIGFNSHVYRKMKNCGLRLHKDFDFMSLHRLSDEKTIAGIPNLTDSSAELMVNLLHRNILSNQYGIPRQMINHVIEPTWVDGVSMRNLNALREGK